MSKRISYFLFAAFTLCFHLSFAQSFNGGLLAGVNASQVSGDGYSGFEKAGLLIGAFSNVDISNTLNLQMEINYSQKGSRRNPNTSEGDTDFYLMRLNYIEVPILLRIDYKRFKFEFGGYYGQLVNTHLEDENGEFEIPEGTNQFNDYDVGLLGGIYFHFTESLLMNFRYSNSIAHFRQYDSEASFLFDSGMFHHVMSVNVRYVIFGEQ